MKQFRFVLIAGFILNLLSAGLCLADPFVGRGCTTAFWIDEDCDGFVVGAKNPVIRAGQITIPTPPNLGADANDNNTSLNTTASFLAQYGNSLQGFKNYLNDLGYTHTIENIFFISPNGNDQTAQRNDVNRPYRTRPRPHCTQDCCTGSCIIGPGDVVVYREGNYPEGLDTQANGYPLWQGFQGTAAQPVLLINYPGERAIFSSSGGGFGFSNGTRHTTVHGMEFEGQYGPNLFARQVVNLDQPSESCTIRYCEARNGDRWIYFGSQIQGRHNLTIDHCVAYSAGMEHILYRNNGAGLPVATEDSGWVLKNNIHYLAGGHGFHWRGGQNFTFENNIVHSVSWFGIEIKNGSRNGTLRNNLIFNTGRGPLVMWNDGDPTTSDDSGIKDMLFENNIFYSKAGDNGFGNSNYPAIRIVSHLPTRPYENIRFYNNILYSVGFVPVELDQVGLFAHLTMENNIFFRDSPGATMMTCNSTDGSHTSVNSEDKGGCTGSGHFWTFGAMQNPTLRPQIVNNIHADPAFTDVTNNYATGRTPGLFDFFPTQNSPSIDFANPSQASPFDLRRNARVGPADAGALEYSAVSSNQPPTVGAGPDQFLPPGVLQTQLNGTASDDGQPNPPGQLFRQWTKAAGPGQVVFGAPTAVDTTVTFSQGGTYDLRFSATDGAIYRSDVVRVIVGTPSSGGGNGPSSGPSNGETEFIGCMDPSIPEQRIHMPICFNLEKSGNVALRIYSKDGKKVRELFNEFRNAGFYTLTWDGKNESGENVSSGIYNMILDGEKDARGKIPVIR